MPICSFCHQEKKTPMLIYKDNKFINYWLFCSECMRLYKTCVTCKNRDKCTFENDISITEQKTIQKTVYTPLGAQTIVQPNPARIEKTCKVCKCGIEGQPCAKQEHTCINWKLSVDS